MKKTVVIIDDEIDILNFLSYNIRKEGYTAETFTNPIDALKYIDRHIPDMVITDWLMPEMEGLELCRKIKMSPKTASIPVFMISCKNDEIDVVTALELGVEDYLTKPFGVKELITRMKKIFYRFSSKSSLETSKHIIIRNELKIDKENFTVYLKDTELSLTYCEFNLLHLLASKPLKVFSRNEIINSINSDNNIVVTPRSVDVQIVGLRKKLGPCKDYIETIRSVGYRFSYSD